MTVLRNWYPYDFVFERVGNSNDVLVKFTFKNSGRRGTSKFNYMPVYHHPSNAKQPSGSWSSIDATPLVDGGTQFGFVYSPPDTDTAHYVSFDMYAEGTYDDDPDDDSNDTAWGGPRVDSPSFTTPAWEDANRAWAADVPQAPTLSYRLASAGNVVLGISCSAPYSRLISIQRRREGDATWSTVHEETRSYTFGEEIGSWESFEWNDANATRGYSYEYRAYCENYTDVAGVHGRMSYYSEILAAETAPARMTGLAAVDAGSDGDNGCAVKLTWKNVGNAGDSIRAEYSSYFRNGRNAWEEGATAEIQSVDARAGYSDEVTITGLQYGTKYGFRVVRSNSKGDAWAMVGTDPNAYTKVFTTPSRPKMARPSALAAAPWTSSDETSTGIRVSWSDLLGDADGYRLEYSSVRNAWTLSADDDITRVDVVIDPYERESATHSVTLTVAGSGIEPGRRYYFQLVKKRGDEELRATAASGASYFYTYTAMADAPDVAVLTPAPSNVAASQVPASAGYGVKVTWTGELRSGDTWEIQHTASSYAFANNAYGDIESVEVGTEEVGSGTSHTYTLTTLEPNTRYHVRIRRRGTDSTTAWSATATATTAKEPTISVPTGMRAGWAVYSDGMFVEITDVPEGTDVSYDIQYSRDSEAWVNGAESTIGHLTMPVQAEQLQWTTHKGTIPPSDLVAGAIYYVRVLKTRGEEQVFAKAGSAGRLAGSDVTVVQKVPAVTDLTLSAPYDLLLATPNYGAIQLTWKGSRLGDESWEIQYTDVANAFATNSEADVQTIAYEEEDAPSTHMYTVSGLADNAAYWLRVRKVASDGRRSAWCAVASEKTLARPKMVRPRDLQAFPYSGAVSSEQVVGVRFTWLDEILDGESYELQYSTVANAWADNIQDAITTVQPDMSRFSREGYVSHEYTITSVEAGARVRARLRKVDDDEALWARNVSGSASQLSDSSYTVFADVPFPSEATLERPTITAFEEIRSGEGMARVDFDAPGMERDQTFEIQWHQVSGSFTNNIAGNITTETFEPSAVASSYRYSLSGLEAGTPVWVRVRKRQGDLHSSWALGPTGYAWAKCELDPPKDEIAGLLAPTANPTDMAYGLDERPVLSWTHNDEGGAAQTAYQVELSLPTGTAYVSGGEASALQLDLASHGLSDGAAVKWRVRTQGAWPGYWSPPSKWQSFRCYARPAAGVSVADGSGGGGPSLGSYPLVVTVAVSNAHGDALPTANRPIECSVSLVAAETFEHVNVDGTTETVAEGQVLMTRILRSYSSATRTFSTRISLWDLKLDASRAYRVEATVATAMGMACSAVPAEFTFDGVADVPEPIATATFDRAGMLCRVRASARTATGALAGNVWLNYYRVQQDGTVEKLFEGVANDGRTYVVDRRCPFGTATYRVVAVDKTTGSEEWSEVVADVPVKEIVLDWDGGRLELPWNIEWDEDHGFDRTLREYQGRSHPVAYFGTQKGHKLTLRTSMVKGRESEKLAALRRMADLREPVYVREPTGLAWWAVATPKISGGYSTAEQQVTLELERVEAPSGKDTAVS